MTTAPRRPLSIEWKVGLALTAALLLLLAIGAVSLRSTAATVASSRLVTHTQEVLTTLEATVSDLVDLQTGARGFIITGDTVFLTPYAAGLRDLQPHLDALRRLTADNPTQLQRLARLDSLATRARSVFSHDIEVRERAGFAAARDVVLTRIGKSTMEAARALVADMAAQERTLLAQRTARAADAARQAQLTATLGALAGFLIALGAAWTIGRDFAGRHRSEAALVTSEARLRVILESMTDGVVVADATGHFTLFNPAAERIVGLGRTDTVPEQWASTYGVFETDQLTPVPTDQLPLVRALRGETVKDVVEFLRNPARPAGVFVSVSGGPLRDKHGGIQGGVVLVSDVTERRRVEAEILRLNNELARQVRELEAVNAELESFSYSVSHDLRAPLRAIDGFSRMLEEDYGPGLDAEARRLIGVVRTNAARMGRLIDDLLQFARVGRQQAHPAPIDMTDLVHGVVADLSETAPAAAVTVQPLPRARGDVVLLRQVWANLISNALKYSAKRSQPTIEIGSTNGTTPGEVGYFIRDNGIGFDMQYADKLFGVFERLHRGSEFDGTGVGLAIVQRIVHRHGGRTWATGEPDKGATFYFTLPETGA